MHHVILGCQRDRAEFLASLVERADHLLYKVYGIFREHGFATLFTDKGGYSVDDKVIAVTVHGITRRS